MHSLEELTARAQKALTHAVIRIVNGTPSPNAADAAVKAAEYPNSMCTAARYLASLREADIDYYEKLTAPILLNRKAPHTDLSDPRIFTCGWSNSLGPGEYESEGLVNVYPKSNLPPLFWDYQVYNHNGTSIARTNVQAGIPHPPRNIKGMFSEGSQSIPLGLQFRMWIRAYSVQIEFVMANQFQSVVWTRRSEENTEGQEFIRRASYDALSTLPQDKICMTNHEDKASDLVLSREIRATGWAGQNFSCTMSTTYRFPSTAAPTMADRIKTDMGPLAITVKKDGITHAKEQGYNALYLARSIGEMLYAPDTIDAQKTLASCFSFKNLEVEMLKCLV